MWGVAVPSHYVPFQASPCLPGSVSRILTSAVASPHQGPSQICRLWPEPSRVPAPLPQPRRKEPQHLTDPSHLLAPSCSPPAPVTQSSKVLSQHPAMSSQGGRRGRGVAASAHQGWGEGWVQGGGQRQVSPHVKGAGAGSYYLLGSRCPLASPGSAGSSATEHRGCCQSRPGTRGQTPTPRCSQGPRHTDRTCPPAHPCNRGPVQGHQPPSPPHACAVPRAPRRLDSGWWTGWWTLRCPPPRLGAALISLRL